MLTHQDLFVRAGEKDFVKNLSVPYPYTVVIRSKTERRVTFILPTDGLSDDDNTFPTSLETLLMRRRAKLSGYDINNFNNLKYNTLRLKNGWFEEEKNQLYLFFDDNYCGTCFSRAIFRTFHTHDFLSFSLHFLHTDISYYRTYYIFKFEWKARSKRRTRRW